MLSSSLSGSCAAACALPFAFGGADLGVGAPFAWGLPFGGGGGGGDLGIGALFALGLPFGAGFGGGGGVISVAFPTALPALAFATPLTGNGTS